MKLKLIKKLFMKSKITLLALCIVFTLQATAQTQIGQTIQGSLQYDQVGSEVAISGDGNVIAVGSLQGDETVDPDNPRAGYIKMYQYNNGNWDSMGAAIPGIELLGDIHNQSGIGNSVVLSDDGNTVAIGEPYDDIPGFDAGSAKIYNYQNGNWVQVGQTLYGEDNESQFGRFLDISGDGSTFFVTAFRNVRTAKVFRLTNGNWTQVGSDFVGPTDPDAGAFISPVISDDGSIVALQTDTREVTVYENSNDTWVQVGDLIDSPFSTGVFGKKIDISGNGSTIAIYATDADNNGASHYTYVYKNIAGVWTQEGQAIVDTDGDYLGYELSLSKNGNVLGLGGFGYDTASYQGAGVVKVFQNIAGTWTQLGANVEGNTQSDQFGVALSISDNGIVIVGSRQLGGTSTYLGEVQVYDYNSLLLSVDDQLLQPSVLDVYPNPTRGIVNIVTSNDIDIQNVLVYDILGQEVKFINGNVNSINLTNLSSGLYIAKIATTQGEKVFRIVKD